MKTTTAYSAISRMGLSGSSRAIRHDALVIAAIVGVPAWRMICFGFAPQDREDGFDTRLSKGCQAPRRWASHTNSGGPKRERLEYVRATPESAVDHDGTFAVGALHDFGQTLNRRSEMCLPRVRHGSK